MKVYSGGQCETNHQRRMDTFRAKMQLNTQELLEEASILARYHYRNELADRSINLRKGIARDGLMTFYSMSCLVREWLGIEHQDLRFSVPHGISFNKSVVKGDEYPGRSAVLWHHAYSSRYKKGWGCISTPSILYMPPPMVILEALRKTRTQEVEQKGCSMRISHEESERRCLFVMPHSTHELGLEYQDEMIRQRIRILREEYRHVDCLAYFLDTERVWNLEREFSRIYCCGHALDPGFLVRLYAVIVSCEAVSYLEIGTPAYHAASLGRRVIHNDYQCSYINISEKTDSQACYLTGLDREWLEKLRSNSGKDIKDLLLMQITAEEDIEECKESLTRLQQSWAAWVWLVTVKTVARFAMAGRMCKNIIVRRQIRTQEMG